MRTTKTISVWLPPKQLKEMERVAKETFRRHQECQSSPMSLPEAARLLREDARAKGTDKLTMREINSEIAAVRRSRGRKSKPPVA